jgi:BA14K-like protein
MMTFKTGYALAAIAVAVPMTAVSNANAAPLAAGTAISTPTALTTGENSLLTQVQWRGRRGGWGGAGIGLGLAAGALIGGAIAAGSSPYYGGYGPGYGYGYGGPVYAPAPAYAAPAYGGGDDEAYCMQRYRSYDPASGTYLNNDGNRYPCP